MATNRFLYQLIRFIPDLERMEPRNLGVIVQGGGEIDVKLNRHATKWSDAKGHAETVRKWFGYFEGEIKGFISGQTDILIPIPIETLMPDRGSERFLDYLMKQATGQIRVSRPFVMEYRTEKPLNAVIDELYRKLVSADAEPEGTVEEKAAVRKSIAGKFSQLSHNKHFRERGLVENGHVMLPEGVSRVSYRHFKNGDLNLIEKVEFNDNAFMTGLEINNLLLLLREKRIKSFGEDIKLTILLEPFCEFPKMPAEENKAFLKDREEIGSRALEQGAKIIEDVESVSVFVLDLDKYLPKMQLNNIR
jgi:hypothetical protein